jgi:hypothetical protein
MANDCLTRLLSPEIQKEIFGENTQVPEELVRRVVQDIEAIKKNVAENPNVAGKFESRVADYIRKQRELNEIQLRSRAENLRKNRLRLSFYDQPGFKKNPAEAFKALLTTSTTLANGSEDSITARSAAMLDDYANYVFGKVESLGKGTFDLFTSGNLDRDVYRATESLALGKELPKGTPTEVGQIAEALHNLNKVFFSDMRDAGVPVREMPGYITRQTHNVEAVRAAGFEGWAKEIFPKLDQVKTFGPHAGNAEATLKSLKGVYDSILSGRYGLDGQISDTDLADNFLTTGGVRAISDKLSEARVLRFKDADGAFEYNQSYGKGNLAQGLFETMKRNAREIALMQKFGDKPEAAIRADIERVAAKLRKAGDEKGAENFLSQQKRILSIFNSVASVDRTPGNQTIAKIGSGIRTMNVLSKLFAVGVRSFANFATGAVELRNATGKNLLQAQSDIFLGWAKSLPEGVRQTFSRKASVVLNDMQMATMEQTWAASAGGIGNRLARWEMKINGQDIMNNSMAHAMGNLLQENLAENITKSFRDLDPKMQARLLASGIDQHDFKVLGHAVETLDDSSRQFVTPEAIKDIPKEAAQAAIQAKGLKGYSASKYLRELELKLRSQIIQASNIATTTAGAREQTALTMGTDAGTVAGEVMRLWTQFKSFTLQSVNIGKRFANANPDPQALAQGVAVSQGKDMKGLAHWLVAGTAIAYGADTLWRASQGKGPLDPTSPETWIDAFGKGGAGGMYVDFLTGEWDKKNRNFAESFAGPTFGQLAPLAKIAAMGRKSFTTDEGFSSKIAEESTRLMRNNIPFQQVPMIKQGLDYLQYDTIQEMLSPGFKAKHELAQTRARVKGR